MLVCLGGGVNSAGFGGMDKILVKHWSRWRWGTCMQTFGESSSFYTSSLFICI